MEDVELKLSDPCCLFSKHFFSGFSLPTLKHKLVAEVLNVHGDSIWVSQHSEAVVQDWLDDFLLCDLVEFILALVHSEWVEQLVNLSFFCLSKD